MRLTRDVVALASAMVLAASVRAQDHCPLGMCSPRLAAAMVGQWAPSVTLGVFWTKTFTPPPLVPAPGAGPASVVEPHWSLRALLSAGVTFASPRDYTVDVTGFGYIGALRDVAVGPRNRAGPMLVRSVKPDAAGLAARVEAPARVAGLQLGWVRVFDGEVNRMFGSLDLSFGFLACDMLQRCGAGDRQCAAS
jgi:hypothetical protein